MNLNADNEAIEAEAADWLAKREGERWSTADQVALDRWLEVSVGHRVAFIRLQAAWERAERLRALGAGKLTDTLPERGSWSPGTPSVAAESSHDMQATDAWRLRYMGRWKTRAAAAILASVGIAGGYWHWAYDRASIYATQIGGLSSIPLADGSTVTLNTDSEIAVRLNSTERQIDLKRGEAFFQVARQPNRPFVVTMGSRQVTAVGTEFAILRDASQMRVLVTNGSVHVVDHDLPAAAGELSIGEGTEVAATATGFVIDHPDRTRIDQMLGWRGGYVIFHDTPLPDAVADLNRYNTRKIVIDDMSLGEIQIGGRFRSNDVDAFVSLLETGFPVKVSHTADDIHLARRAGSVL